MISIYASRIMKAVKFILSFNITTRPAILLIGFSVCFNGSLDILTLDICFKLLYDIFESVTILIFFFK